MARLDPDRIKEIVTREYRLAAAEGPFLPRELVDRLVVELRTAEIDNTHLLRTFVQQVVNGLGRNKAGGKRLTEISYNAEGERVDTLYMQQTLPGLLDVAERKIANGEASVAQGLADRAVLAEARQRCVARGLIWRSAHVCDVLTEDEVAEIRDGFRKAA